MVRDSHHHMGQGAREISGRYAADLQIRRDRALEAHGESGDRDKEIYLALGRFDIRYEPDNREDEEHESFQGEADLYPGRPFTVPGHDGARKSAQTEPADRYGRPEDRRDMALGDREAHDHRIARHICGEYVAETYIADRVEGSGNPCQKVYLAHADSDGNIRAHSQQGPFLSS